MIKQMAVEEEKRVIALMDEAAALEERDFFAELELLDRLQAIRAVIAGVEGAEESFTEQYGALELIKPEDIQAFAETYSHQYQVAWMQQSAAALAPAINAEVARFEERRGYVLQTVSEEHWSSSDAFTASEALYTKKHFVHMPHDCAHMMRLYILEQIQRRITRFEPLFDAASWTARIHDVRPTYDSRRVLQSRIEEIVEDAEIRGIQTVCAFVGATRPDGTLDDETYIYAVS